MTITKRNVKLQFDIAGQKKVDSEFEVKDGVDAFNAFRSIPGNENKTINDFFDYIRGEIGKGISDITLIPSDIIEWYYKSNVEVLELTISDDGSNSTVSPEFELSYADGRNFTGEEDPILNEYLVTYPGPMIPINIERPYDFSEPLNSATCHAAFYSPLNANTSGVKETVEANVYGQINNEGPLVPKLKLGFAFTPQYQIQINDGTPLPKAKMGYRLMNPSVKFRKVGEAEFKTPESDVPLGSVADPHYATIRSLEGDPNMSSYVFPPAKGEWTDSSKAPYNFQIMEMDGDGMLQINSSVEFLDVMVGDETSAVVTTAEIVPPYPVGYNTELNLLVGYKVTDSEGKGIPDVAPWLNNVLWTTISAAQANGNIENMYTDSEGVGKFFYRVSNVETPLTPQTNMTINAFAGSLPLSGNEVILNNPLYLTKRVSTSVTDDANGKKKYALKFAVSLNDEYLKSDDTSKIQIEGDNSSSVKFTPGEDLLFTVTGFNGSTMAKWVIKDLLTAENKRVQAYVQILLNTDTITPES